MEKQTLLSADYLDIIYDQRNKEYGGYELRKHYDRRVRKSLAFLLLGVSALASFSFTPSREKSMVIQQNGPVVLTDVTIDPPKEVMPPKPEVVPPAPPPAPVKMKLNVEPVITEETVPDDKHMTENKEMRDAVSGPANNDVDSGLSIGPSIVNKKPGSGPAVITEVKPLEPVLWVQQMPEFIGNMNDYISKHINYPESARSAGIEGRVYVKFVVNEDGSVSNAAVARGIGGGCDEEALRIVRGMPKWKAGKQNGMAVKVYFTLPLAFVIN